MSIQVDMANTKSLHEAYWDFRLVSDSVPWSKRSPNMPSEITEAIVCLCTSAVLIDSGHGDILLPSGLIGEVKGTSSCNKDLSSFSPSSNFDALFFVHMDKGTNNIYHVYDLEMNRKEIMPIKVNNTATFEDHCRGNRRPRFSIINQIILPLNKKPRWKVDIETGIILDMK